MAYCNAKLQRHGVQYSIQFDQDIKMLLKTTGHCTLQSLSECTVHRFYVYYLTKSGSLRSLRLPGGIFDLSDQHGFTGCL